MGRPGDEQVRSTSRVGSRAAAWALAGLSLALLAVPGAGGPPIASAAPRVGGPGPAVSQVEPVPPEGRFWQETPAPAEVPTGLAPLVERLSPAVVNVFTTDRQRESAPSDIDELLRRFFGPGGPGGRRPPGGRLAPQRRRGPGTDGPLLGPRRRGIGSGFILSADGYVVTNDHLVRGADEIKVRLLDEREFRARVVGRDPKLDLALVKLKDARDLPTLPLGDSDVLRVGDEVIAIGNPFGLGHTVTRGIVSAKARVIGAGPYDDFIQTDASINPGNSGGPLLDRSGQVIGINTAISAQGQGIGFAIPVNLAKAILYQLHEKGRVVRGYLGVNIQHLTADLAETFGLPDAHGALVSEVRADSPAGQAGLQPGDVILSLDGQPLRRAEQLPLRVASAPPGRQLTLDLARGRKRYRVKVTLAETRGEVLAERPARTRPRQLGLGLGRRGPGQKGLLVDTVDPEGPASGLIEAGDLLLQLGQQRLLAPSDLVQADRALVRGQAVPLLVERGGQRAWVSVSPRVGEAAGR